VSYDTSILDEAFPEWGDSRYVNLHLHGKVRLRDLLKHIYILLPVFDKHKHYWVGEDEVEKLLHSGEDWLAEHPERKYIVDRYLYRKRSLVSEYFARFNDDSPEQVIEQEDLAPREPSLNEQRLEAVLHAIKRTGATKVIDLGCGEGKLIGLLLKDRQFTKIAGMDVSQRTLKHASDRLKMRNANEHNADRLTLFQSSITYKDKRTQGFDTASVIEVIEHLDATRLGVFEHVLFGYIAPRSIVLTTPNRDYNVLYENMSEGALRHHDHRFEWTRREFKAWAEAMSAKYGYQVTIDGIGTEHEDYGAPTQMGVFERCE
jgi:3' terminal RNA ribose 2'-O-methyltransferase Hen1